MTKADAVPFFFLAPGISRICNSNLCALGCHPGGYRVISGEEAKDVDVSRCETLAGGRDYQGLLSYIVSLCEEARND